MVANAKIAVFQHFVRYFPSLNYGLVMINLGKQAFAYSLRKYNNQGNIGMCNFHKTKLFPLFSLITLLLTGCHTERKNLVETGDSNLSCNELSAEIATVSSGRQSIENLTIAMRAQKALINEGYAPGVADGIIGPKTKIALEEYQTNNGLTVTGKLDKATEKSLLLENTDPSITKEKPKLTMKSHSTSRLVKDAAIEFCINKNILADKLFANAGHNIVTSVLNGVVLFTGIVFNEKQKSRAGQIAKGYTGVLQVVNQLVLSGETIQNSYSDDRLITEKVKDELFRKNVVDLNNIKVVTSQGVVYLLGIVTPTQADTTIALVKQINGVIRIVKVFMRPA